MKIKWLRGDNSVNIQSRIMIIVHCPSSHCHLSKKKVLIPSVVLDFRRTRCPTDGRTKGTGVSILKYV